MRTNYLNQNHYHFPDGIRYLYKRAKENALGKPEFEIFFEEKAEDFQFQVFIGYRADWYPQPHIVSFANDKYTINGGTLVSGLLDGLASAFKAFVKQEQLSSHKIRAKKFINGLILICSVRGENFCLGGSFGETLEEPRVKYRIKKALHSHILKAIEENPEATKSFLSRFDENLFTHKMY